MFLEPFLNSAIGLLVAAAPLAGIAISKSSTSGHFLDQSVSFAKNHFDVLNFR